MRTNGMWAIGLASMMVVIGVGSAASSFAADTKQESGVESRMGHGGSSYSLSQPDGASACQVAEVDQAKVDVIERIGAGGSTYSSSQPASAQVSICQEVGRKVGVVQRIGHGGSTYSSSQSTVRTAGR